MEYLIFQLIALAIGLIGKFWPLILAYIFYRLFVGKGKQDRREQQPKPRRTVTYPPVAPDRPFEWEWEPPLFEEKPMQAERREEQPDWPPYDERETALDPSPPQSVSAKPEPAMAEVQSQPVPISISASPMPAVQRTEGQQQAAPPLNPREAMKWALIFSPPKGRMQRVPYRR